MPAHLCLTLIIEELKISVEYDRVIKTLNTIKHYISYLVYLVYVMPFKVLAGPHP